MTDDGLEDRTTEFIHALAASKASVANIAADRMEDSMTVTFDLIDHNDLDCVEVIAAEHGFEAAGDTGERFESVE